MSTQTLAEIRCMRASEIVTKTVGFGNRFSEDQELLLDPFPKPINSIEKWVLEAQKPKVSWPPKRPIVFGTFKFSGPLIQAIRMLGLFALWALRQPALLAGDDPTGAGNRPCRLGSQRHQSPSMFNLNLLLSPVENGPRIEVPESIQNRNCRFLRLGGSGIDFFCIKSAPRIERESKSESSVNHSLSLPLITEQIAKLFCPTEFGTSPTTEMSVWG
ncbi:hypothetical protein C8R45DRAFT_937358 [Mycena sanguinolenta]|nr:hypothetical protein C8R45DRAFT_937358 [Mycena sanguinolenta]